MLKNASIAFMIFAAVPALANEDARPKPPRPQAVEVHGPIAKEIWDALNVQSETHDTDRGPIEMKKAGTLHCGKVVTADAEAKELYRCGMLGKKGHPPRGPRPGDAPFAE